VQQQALAVQGAPQVPVRGVNESHRRAMDLRERAEPGRSGRGLVPPP
jgi:hypothetical protein